MCVLRLLRTSVPVLVSFALACSPPKAGPEDGTTDADSDSDSDGFPASEDCDDTDDAIHPDASEVCDGVDNDCDGAVDDADDSLDLASADTFYADADEDNFGDADAEVQACAVPDGFVTDDSDCDDTDGAIHPDAVEVCDLADVDEDCSGAADDADSGVDPASFDTYYVDADEDSHGDPTRAVERCDLATGFSELADDCDDTDASIYPDAPDTWYDGVDSDCDGANDYDADADGYDSDAHGGADCDDTSAAFHPGATDVWYDGLDHDCAGDDDYDADVDGFASDAHAGTDCNDADSSVSPAATEVWYDGVDQDCDGASDYDADSDGYDSDSYTGTDCDDADSSVNPGATEAWYDGVDADCDGANDYDADADGYDSDAHGGADCDDTSSAFNPGATDVWYDGFDHDCAGNDDYDADADGYTSDAYAGTDCDDADSSVNPGATEGWYDGVDQDCDAASDYDADSDGEDSDGYGGVDCDDADAAVNTSAIEECDGIDNNCNGDTDFGICGVWSMDEWVQIGGGAAYDALSYPNVGDVDGDGQMDLMGSSVGYGTGSTSFDYGAAFLFYGPITADTDTNSADWFVSGANAGDALGAGQPNMADLNGDGWDDMLIPARYDDNNKGEVLLYLGSATRRTSSTTSSNSGAGGYYGRIYGSLTGSSADNFGTSGTSHIGDIDGDGHLDLSIGHSYDDVVSTNDGRGSALLVMSGSSTLTGGAYASIGATRVYGEGNGSRLSLAASAGDVDGDGMGDLMFTSPNPSSSGSSLPPYVYLVDGTESALVGGGNVDVSTIWMARYTVHSGQGGSSITGRGGGDIDGDGYSDLLITDNYATDTLLNQVGHAYVVLGSASISGAAAMDSAYSLLIYGTATSSGNTRFGETGAVTPDRDGDGVYEDFDGDGDADVVVGQNDYTDGGVYVFFSSTLAAQLGSGTSSVNADTLADAKLEQPNASDEARDIAFGDLDGDGSTDLIVGASGYDAGGSTGTGGIFIIPGTLQ